MKHVTKKSLPVRNCYIIVHISYVRMYNYLSDVYNLIFTNDHCGFYRSFALYA